MLFQIQLILAWLCFRFNCASVQKRDTKTLWIISAHTQPKDTAARGGWFGFSKDDGDWDDQIISFNTYTHTHDRTAFTSHLIDVAVIRTNRLWRLHVPHAGNENSVYINNTISVIMNSDVWLDTETNWCQVRSRTPFEPSHTLWKAVINSPLQPNKWRHTTGWKWTHL